MPDQGPPTKNGGDGIWFSKHQNFNRTGTNYLRKSKPTSNSQALATTRKHRMVQFIGYFDNRVIEHGTDNSFFHHLLHCPSTRTVGVENDGFVPGVLESLKGFHRP